MKIIVFLSVHKKSAEFQDEGVFYSLLLPCSLKYVKISIQILNFKVGNNLVESLSETHEVGNITHDFRVNGNGETAILLP